MSTKAFCLEGSYKKLLIWAWSNNFKLKNSAKKVCKNV